ncbi:MAG: glycosyltransferase [Vicinamibacterales bacterium]
MLSLIVPVYRNEDSLPRLLAELVKVHSACPMPLELVFVVDGSPDRSAAILEEALPALPFSSRLVELSRNFGSFAAIMAGLREGRGDYFAMMAADLQEPSSLPLQFLAAMQERGADVVFGTRASRNDPWLTSFSSRLFWKLFRTFVVSGMPRGGVDCFGCTKAVRDQLLRCEETTTNLVALLFWAGYRREFVSYDRMARREGRSAWTLSKKMTYFVDSVFNFTDLPARLLLYAGALGLVACAAATALVMLAWMRGIIPVLGYTPLAISLASLGALTSLGLGIVGQYAWLTLRNARRRPNFLVARVRDLGPIERDLSPIEAAVGAGETPDASAPVADPEQPAGLAADALSAPIEGSPSRVLLVSHSPILTGGAERSLLEIARFLHDRSDFSVVVAVPADGPMRGAVLDRGIACVVLPFGWGVYAPGNEGLSVGIAGLHAMRQFLLDWRPDVVLTNTSVIPWFAYLSRRLGIPHAWFLREYVGDDNDIDFYPDPGRALQLIGECADRVFVNSEFMRARYEVALQRRDIDVVYPTIDRAILDHVPRDVSDEGSEHGSARTSILVFGSIMPRKNQLELLKAAAILHRRRQDFTVTVMGPIGARDYFDSMLVFVREQRLDAIVRFVANQDNPFVEVARHDICVVPSVREPFGRVLLEAMILKRAVAASDIAGTREILAAAPDAGLLYPVGEPAALAERLEALIADPAARRALGQRAHDYAIARFVQSDGLARLAAALHALARAPKPARTDWVTDLLMERCRGASHAGGRTEEPPAASADTLARPADAPRQAETTEDAAARDRADRPGL